jgi:hypothetical protein
VPDSVDNVRFADSYDYVLNQTLIATAIEIPADNIGRFGLDQAACALLKRAKFNATTFAFEHGPLIGFNYALKPILKHFNRFMFHYCSTQYLAGPVRLARAWQGIVPTELDFWSDVTANMLTQSSPILYSKDRGADKY